MVPLYEAGTPDCAAAFWVSATVFPWNVAETRAPAGAVQPKEIGSPTFTASSEIGYAGLGRIGPGNGNGLALRSLRKGIGTCSNRNISQIDAKATV